MKKGIYITLSLGILISCVQKTKSKQTENKSNKILVQEIKTDTIRKKDDIKNLDLIDNEVKLIESDSTLIKKEFDWMELTETVTDGGGILKVWRNKKQICKIVEEIGLSYGRIRTIIYLNNEIPIKIIETEENFGIENGELNYKKLNEVFKATIHVFDWENDESKIKRTGKRILSEGSCSTFDYEPIMKRAKKTTIE